MFDNVFFWICIIVLYLSNQIINKTKNQLSLISFISPVVFYNFFGLDFVLLTISIIIIIFFLSNEINFSFIKISQKKLLLIFLVIILLFNKKFDLQIIGLSYFLIRLYDYIQSDKSDVLLLDRRSKIIKYVHLYGYLFPLHGILAGPLMQYKNFVNFEKRKITLLLFQKSIFLILTGLIFKYIFAFYLSLFIEELIVNSLLKSSMALIYVFFDFAGYSLVAVGIGILIGYELPINFNNPFSSKTLGEFFERWHISLSLMAKKHIFNPFQLFLIRSKFLINIKLISSISLIITFVFIAMWHKISVNFLYWGLFLGVVLSIEHFFVLRKRVNDTLQNTKFVSVYSFVLSIYTFLVVSCSYFILSDDLYIMIS